MLTITSKKTEDVVITKNIENFIENVKVVQEMYKSHFSHISPNKLHDVLNLYYNNNTNILPIYPAYTSYDSSDPMEYSDDIEELLNLYQNTINELSSAYDWYTTNEKTI